MIAETPYTILAIRNHDAVCQMAIDMANGSYETVAFPTIGSQTQNFNKVLTDESVGRALIDWKDCLKIEDYLTGQLKQTLEFISRPIDETIVNQKNFLFR